MAETIRFAVPDGLASSAYITPKKYEELYQQSITDPERFWDQQARSLLQWHSLWSKVVTWDFEEANIQWFLGGKLNVSENCLDRHLQKRGEKTAIVWEGNEPGESRRITYRELHRDVCRVATALRKLGVKKGDRVAIYLPMVPEAAVCMLACARIGAIHTVVFAGFSAESLRDRINDCGCKLLITANEGLRGSKSIPLKETSDTAVSQCPSIKHIIVVKRTDTVVPMKTGRDLSYDDLLAQVGDEVDTFR